MTLYEITPVARAITQDEQLIVEKAIQETLGNIADEPALDDVGEFTLMSLLKRLATGVTDIIVNTEAGAVPTTSISGLTTPVLTVDSAVLLPALATRKKWSIFNPGNSTMFLEYGDIATVASGLPIPGGYLWIDDFNYVGAVSGVVAAATQSIQVRQFS